MELVRREMPVHDSSAGDFGEKVRAYVRRRAEIEGKRLTERQVDELTKSLLDYRREIVEGLSALNHIGLRSK